MKKNPMAILGISLLIISLFFTHINHANANATPIQNGTIQLGQQTKAEYPSLAKITLDLAVANALKAVPGKVVQTELENSDGFLVYGIDVATEGQTIVDVKVDAGSGQVLTMDQKLSHDEDHEQDEHNEDGENRD